MANIALVTAATSHAAYTATKSALETAGHTVTGFNMSAVTSSNLAAYDVIVCVRCLTSDGSYSAFVPILIAYSNTYHKPIMVGYDSASGSGTATIGLPVELKLAEKLTAASSGPSAVRASSPHAVWTAISVTVPSDYTVLTGAASFINKIDLTGLSAGTVIGTYSSSDNSPVLVLAEQGQPLLSSATAGAKIAYAAFLYGGTAYAAGGIALLDALVDWLLSTPAVLVGTVTDHLGAPLERTVRAYLRSNGAFAGAAVSDPADGSFSIIVSNPDQLHYLVALDELSGEKNALIKDRVLPYV
jgi:hypothetical protein